MRMKTFEALFTPFLVLFYSYLHHRNITQSSSSIENEDLKPEGVTKVAQVLLWPQSCNVIKRTQILIFRTWEGCNYLTTFMWTSHMYIWTSVTGGASRVAEDTGDMIQMRKSEAELSDWCGSGWWLQGWWEVGAGVWMGGAVRWWWGKEGTVWGHLVDSERMAGLESRREVWPGRSEQGLRVDVEGWRCKSDRKGDPRSRLWENWSRQRSHWCPTPYKDISLL